MEVGQNEFSIKTYPHGAAIFGEISVNDLIEQIKIFNRKGFTLMHPGIASALGANFVVTNKSGGKKWFDELNQNDWINGPDTGLSSKTIYAVMTGKLHHIDRYSPGSAPHDPDDFGRCYRLLELHPEWLPRMGEVAERYPIWRRLVENWDRMTAIYERDFPTGKSAELYRMMQEFRGGI